MNEYSHNAMSKKKQKHAETLSGKKKTPNLNRKSLKSTKHIKSVEVPSVSCLNKDNVKRKTRCSAVFAKDFQRSDVLSSTKCLAKEDDFNKKNAISKPMSWMHKKDVEVLSTKKCFKEENDSKRNAKCKPMLEKHKKNLVVSSSKRCPEENDDDKKNAKDKPMSWMYKKNVEVLSTKKCCEEEEDDKRNPVCKPISRKHKKELDLLSSKSCLGEEDVNKRNAKCKTMLRNHKKDFIVSSSKRCLEEKYDDKRNAKCNPMSWMHKKSVDVSSTKKCFDNEDDNRNAVCKSISRKYKKDLDLLSSKRCLEEKDDRRNGKCKLMSGKHKISSEVISSKKWLDEKDDDKRNAKCKLMSGMYKKDLEFSSSTKCLEEESDDKINAMLKPMSGKNKNNVNVLSSKKYFKEEDDDKRNMRRNLDQLLQNSEYLLFEKCLKEGYSKKRKIKYNAALVSNSPIKKFKFQYNLTSPLSNNHAKSSLNNTQPIELNLAEVSLTAQNIVSSPSTESDTDSRVSNLTGLQKLKIKSSDNSIRTQNIPKAKTVLPKKHKLMHSQINCNPQCDTSKKCKLSISPATCTNMFKNSCSSHSSIQKLKNSPVCNSIINNDTAEMPSLKAVTPFSKNNVKKKLSFGSAIELNKCDPPKLDCMIGNDKSIAKTALSCSFKDRSQSSGVESEFSPGPFHIARSNNQCCSVQQVKMSNASKIPNCLSHQNHKTVFKSANSMCRNNTPNSKCVASERTVSNGCKQATTTFLGFTECAIPNESVGISVSESCSPTISQLFARTNCLPGNHKNTLIGNIHEKHGTTSLQSRSSDVIQPQELSGDNSKLSMHSEQKSFTGTKSPENQRLFKSHDNYVFFLTLKGRLPYNSIILEKPKGLGIFLKCIKCKFTSDSPKYCCNHYINCSESFPIKKKVALDDVAFACTLCWSTFNHIELIQNHSKICSRKDSDVNRSDINKETLLKCITSIEILAINEKGSKVKCVHCPKLSFKIDIEYAIHHIMYHQRYDNFSNSDSEEDLESSKNVNIRDPQTRNKISRSDIKRNCHGKRDNIQALRNWSENNSTFYSCDPNIRPKGNVKRTIRTTTSTVVPPSVKPPVAQSSQQFSKQCCNCKLPLVLLKPSKLEITVHNTLTKDSSVNQFVKIPVELWCDKCDIFYSSKMSFPLHILERIENTHIKKIYNLVNDETHRTNHLRANDTLYRYLEHLFSDFFPDSNKFAISFRSSEVNCDNSITHSKLAPQETVSESEDLIDDCVVIDPHCGTSDPGLVIASVESVTKIPIVRVKKKGL